MQSGRAGFSYQAYVHPPVEKHIRVNDERDLVGGVAEESRKPPDMIEVPVAQDRSFDCVDVDATFLGIMEEAVR